MTSRARAVIAALVLLAVLGGVLLIAFAGNACPGETPSSPCANAGINRTVVVALAAMTVTLAVVPFALLAEFAVRRRIIYRGAWGRASRRGALIGAAVAAMGALRLGGALSVPVALFVIGLATVAEWFAIRRFDTP
ncbi:MAG: hypothetical protein M3R32_02160 [Chloroflexota bacterium]|nr:hypothetical protein [Chloroflexota bacterium]